MKVLLRNNNDDVITRVRKLKYFCRKNPIE